MLDNERARFESDRAQLEEAKQKFIQSGQVDEDYKQKNRTSSSLFSSQDGGGAAMNMAPVSLNECYPPSEVAFKTLAHDSGG